MPLTADRASALRWPGQVGQNILSRFLVRAEMQAGFSRAEAELDRRIGVLRAEMQAGFETGDAKLDPSPGSKSLVPRAPGLPPESAPRRKPHGPEIDQALQRVLELGDLESRARRQ